MPAASDVDVISSSTSPSIRRERQYWLAATREARGDPSQALAAASDGLQMLSRVGNDELQWRLAAIGCNAAHSLGDGVSEATMRARASEALSRIRAHWGDYVGRYENRPDLTELRRKAGL
jgi:hypothetical protein